MQTFKRIESYLYGASPFIVCESERLMVCILKEKLEMLEEKFEMQSNKCESEMYAEEKEKCEMFLKNVNDGCKKEIRKYTKLKNINDDKFWWLR